MYSILAREKVGEVVMYKKGVLDIIETDLYDIMKIAYLSTPALKVKDDLYIQKGHKDFSASDCFVLSGGMPKTNEGIVGVKIKKKIPADIILRVRKILQVIYDLRKTEGSVMVTYDPETKEFDVCIPKQAITSASVTIEPSDIDVPLVRGLKIAAFLHSHPFSSNAFLSGTDHAHASNLSFAPIGSFNFNPNKMPVKQSDIYNFGEPKCEFHDLPIDWEDLMEVPVDVFEITAQERKDLEEILKDKIPAVRTYGYQAHIPHRGHIGFGSKGKRSRIPERALEGYPGYGHHTGYPPGWDNEMYEDELLEASEAHALGEDLNGSPIELGGEGYPQENEQTNEDVVNAVYDVMSQFEEITLTLESGISINPTMKPLRFEEFMDALADALHFEDVLETSIESYLSFLDPKDRPRLYKEADDLLSMFLSTWSDEHMSPHTERGDNVYATTLAEELKKYIPIVDQEKIEVSAGYTLILVLQCIEVHITNACKA